MKPKKWVVAVIAVLLLGMLGVIVIIRPPFWVYAKLSSGPRELPNNLVRSAFRFVTGQELPQEAGDVRAIFHGGRDPSVFLRFRTDSQGVQAVITTFKGLGAGSEAIDREYLPALSASGGSLFYVPVQWQNRLGISLCDETSIGAGQILRSVGAGGLTFTVLIDDDQHTAYIFAMRLD